MVRLTIVAVSTRLPGWAESACSEYLKRMPRGYETQRVRVKPDARNAAKSVDRMLHDEAIRVRAAMPRDARLVSLDERGADLGTTQLAARLREWLDSGTATAFLIGGPDGLDEQLRRDSAATLRLSSLTLPHALAQVVLCEQLYRAASLLVGHPYHRP